jgi:hypothetical protein
MPLSKRGTPPAMKVSLGACLILGLGLLYVSAEFSDSLSPNAMPWLKSLWPVLFDLLHDLGIGLCVSFVVALLFEIYRNTRHEIESMRSVIEAVMGDKLTPEIWEEVIDQIEVKEVLRRQVSLRLELTTPFGGLMTGEARLAVEHSYDLIALRDKKTKYRVRSELDYQLSRPNIGLPKWDRVLVVPIAAKVGNAGIDLSLPELDFEVSLEPRSHDDVVHIQTRRFEIVRLPGSYNLYLPEFMKGFTLDLVGRPSNIDAEVIVRPHGGAKALPKTGVDSWRFEGLIFPGQGIEIKFKEAPPAPTPAPAPPPAPAPALAPVAPPAPVQGVEPAAEGKDAGISA